MTLFLSLCAAAAYTLGGICMKLSDGFNRPWPSIGVFYLFALGAAIQTIVTTKNELAVSYIVVLGLEAVLALAFGIFIFKEGVSVLKIAGFMLVIIGVGCLRSAS
jgi:multidrug transporter EmrE-like cation transporter